MTQETLNIVLAIWAVAAPIITILIQKYFSKNKDSADYGSDLLDMLNQATEALKKSRDEANEQEDTYEKTISAIRQEHSAAMASMRSEYDARINRLKNRVLELESVQKIYEIKFDLVTHPNVEVKNVSAKAMDDVSASQKMKAIQAEQSKSE